MRIVIKLDGETYVSPECSDDHKEAAETMRDKFWAVELDNGDYLVLGRDSVQRAHIIFKK